MLSRIKVVYLVWEIADYAETCAYLMDKMLRNAWTVVLYVKTLVIIFFGILRRSKLHDFVGAEILYWCKINRYWGGIRLDRILNESADRLNWIFYGPKNYLYMRKVGSLKTWHFKFIFRHREGQNFRRLFELLHRGNDTELQTGLNLGFRHCFLFYF